MSHKTKCYVYVTTFLAASLCYLTVLVLFPHSLLVQTAKIFRNEWINLLILVSGFLCISFGLTEVIDYVHRYVASIKLRRTKLGKILISQGYLTEKELTDALSEQKLRIGEILVQAGRITAQQLEQALDHQRKASNMLGEILIEMGYAKKEDISWALKKQDRKLGTILQEKGLLAEHEVRRFLQYHKLS